MKKTNFDTVRDLEHRNSGLFRNAIIIGIIGFIMIPLGFIPFFTVLGIGLVAIAIALFFYAMLYTMKLQKEPTVTVYCPYCAVKNDVFRSRKEFACDICHRRIGFGPSGEPIALDKIQEED